MEYKLNEIFTCKVKGKTVYLEVTNTKDYTCRGCFFHVTDDCDYCSNIRNILGQCDACLRTDNTPIIFKKINKINNK